MPDIKIKASGMEQVNKLEEAKREVLKKLFEGEDMASEKLRLPDLEQVSTNDNYEELLDEIMLADVEYVTILGDE